VSCKIEISGMKERLFTAWMLQTRQSWGCR
jgi:hypothetical protein